MATEKDAANTAVKHEGDHDRVAMLSLHADGTPDQHNPEIIGDKEFALEATRRQFAEQAVSAQDADRRAVAADAASAAETVEQDPTIAKAQAEDEKTAAAAEKAADKVVESLHKG